MAVMVVNSKISNNDNSLTTQYDWYAKTSPMAKITK